jgi:hypothetical protein
MTTPTFLVVGAARCGTTGLVEGLRSHPRVFVTDPKEPHYFALHRVGASFTAPGDAHTINRVAVTARGAYLALYPAEHSYVALGDASVSTMYYPEESIPEIKAMNSDMKLVVMLRDPVARAWSSHQYMRARGFETEPDFLAAVALEEERKAAGWHHIWHYTSQSRYAHQVEALLDAFPREQVGVFFFDDLERDYDKTLRRVLEFLDVPDPEAAGRDIPRVNISGRPRFAAAHTALGWAVGNERVRTFVKEHTSYRFRERIRRTLLRQDVLPAAAREQLDPLFADDLARLRAMLGNDGPEWLMTGGAS